MTISSVNILFTDESSFFPHHHYNSSVVPTRTQYLRKVNVRAGILGNSVIGPFFIDGNLTTRTYLVLPQSKIIPAVPAFGLTIDEIWFQQDDRAVYNARSDSIFTKYIPHSHD